MATETRSEVGELEEHALERLTEEGVDGSFPPGEEEEREHAPRIRVSIALGFVVIAAAVMVGGVFQGIAAYFWAAVAGILGIALANGASRIRRTSIMLVATIVGIFAIGLLLVAFSGNTSDVFAVGARASEAARSGDVVRPPVDFNAGWRAITGWLMGAIGFGAGWVALEMRRAAFALLIPLPLVAVGAISVPKDAQLVSGLVAVGLFAVGLGVLSGGQLTGDQRPSMAFEIRRAIRALPLIMAIIGLLYVLARLDILFPDPIFDPTQQAQRPKVVPLSKVKDRVLFTVESKVTGPWRIGLLDVYDGRDWRLPPFAETRLKEVPRSGIVNNELVPEEKATFVIKGLGGAVLPGLPNSVGIVADARLAYDRRTGNIRLAEGQIEEGLTYTVVAARIPNVDELKNVADFPKEVRMFLEIPEPPPAVADLLRRAPNTSLWERLDFVRQAFLAGVVAEGAGTPVSIPPSRVHDMLVGSKRGSPFEIVAAQAMLARWAGVPARIGYGYDGGDKVGGGVREVRPKHGAVFLEVYFTGYGWLPVLGNPLQASSSLGGTPKNVAEGVLPSDEISVPILVAIQVDPRNYLFDQVRAVLTVVLPIVLALLIAYYTWPALRKAFRKSRRRTWAKHEGPYARVAVAYAEFRDVFADFGYMYPADTPLMYLDRVTEDREHTELAWLVTRVLWGDLQDVVADQEALAAEELSRSVIKRLKWAHSYTLRMIASVSRVSLRRQYAPRLETKTRRKGATEKAA